MKLQQFERTLKPGEICNVRRNGKLMRKVTAVEHKSRDGRDWLYWYWMPEDKPDLGNYSSRDCGYSGVMIE